MTFAQISRGAAVFLDANVLIYHFTNEPTYGAACTQIVERIEKNLFGASPQLVCWERLRIG
jgi:predicted nucleic acid-binding protein